jgi:NodT family efflux transporter outer membrane factor (OMF) lipoprotein
MGVKGRRHRRQWWREPIRSTVLAVVLLAGCTILAGCTNVGPEFETPDAPITPLWEADADFGVKPTPFELIEWWTVFQDPALDQLVSIADQNNYGLQVAGLRVLEARAQVGIAVGNRYPQVQRGRGGVTGIRVSENSANTFGGGDLQYGQYDLGADVSWEMDFWGRFRRGIESADASLLASIASYDDVLLLLVAQVVDTYALIRTAEEQLRIAHDNVKIQRRSYAITEVNFRNGADSELDVQQARTLLLSTQATIPDLEQTLQQAKNALSTLLGRTPGDLSSLLGSTSAMPVLPTEITVGIPADLLRRRPDVRQAELRAASQSALVGVALTDLYPSFTLVGSIGLVSATGTDTTRTGNSGVVELIDSDSLQYSVGPSFSWNVLNYGRIKNNVRVQDARLQQLLVVYQDTVLQAVREVEDAMVAYVRRQQANAILAEAVTAAKRSADLSLLRYKEGFSGYQRVLDAQQSLVAQQQRYASSQGDAVRSLVAIYKALGGGWQIREGRGFVDQGTRAVMEQRTDWGELLNPGEAQSEEIGDPSARRRPDW